MRCVGPYLRHWVRVDCGDGYGVWCMVYGVWDVRDAYRQYFDIRCLPGLLPVGTVVRGSNLAGNVIFQSTDVDRAIRPVHLDALQATEANLNSGLPE